MTGTPIESATDVIKRDNSFGDSIFQRVAFRSLTIFLLLVVVAWEITRGLNPDTRRLQESFHRTVASHEQSESKLKAERDDLARTNAVLKQSLEALRAYADYEASGRSLRESGQMPIGRLGFPLGTYLEIEGRRAPATQQGISQQAQARHTLGNRLSVIQVNGRLLKTPVIVEFDARDFNAAKYGDQQFVLKGYETGACAGRPEEIPEFKDAPVPALAGALTWRFADHFKVTSIVLPTGAALEQLPWINP